MKKLKPILIIIGVITLISIIIVLIIRSNAKAASTNSTGQGNFILPAIFGLPGTAASSPYADIDIPEVSASQMAQLQTACGIPTSRATVEKVYGIKCDWYGL